MAYTEFYCQSGGSNVNAGSTTSNSPTQKVHGNWTNATGVYTVQDGTNPTAYCSVGDWVAVMVDGGSVAASISRVSAVQNATNGTITANTTIIGSKPANQTGTATITIGGAWQGPNGASGFPFTLANFGNNRDSSSHMVRVNMKNDQTYSLTASFAPTVGGPVWVVQGYTSSVNDGGKAVWDGGTSTGALLTGTGTANVTYIDLKFTTSISSGIPDLVATTASGVSPASFIRCVFTGSRRFALNVQNSGGAFLDECEFYGDNTSNTSTAVLVSSGPVLLNRCYIHDNTGNLVSGASLFAGSIVKDSIFDSNGATGLGFSTTTTGAMNTVSGSDFYNNGGDAIAMLGSSSVVFYWIENCNFIKNTGAAINNASAIGAGYVYNCGYGAGTQANGSADTLGNLVQSGTVTYANDVTPYVAPTTGNFSINLAAAEGAGRGAFTETDGTNTGTVGYPDIGAAQAAVSAGTGEVSYGAGS